MQLLWLTNLLSLTEMRQEVRCSSDQLIGYNLDAGNIQYFAISFGQKELKHRYNPVDTMMPNQLEPVKEIYHKKFTHEKTAPGKPGAVGRITT